MGFDLPEHEVSAPPSSRAGSGSAPSKPSVVVSHHPLVPTREPLADPIATPAASVEIDEDQATNLVRAVSDSIEDFLRTGFAVVLDGFGILTPENENGEQTHFVDGNLLCRREESITVSFEKCREITAYHRERFPRLIDTKDLAQATYVALPCDDGLRSSERETRRRITALCRTLRHEVITHGFSGTLAPLGDFYALHNRQGETLNDRFAGADIFIVPRFRRRIRLSETRRLTRPILEHGGEIFEAAYGAPIGKLLIDLAAELHALGYTLSPAEEAQFLGTRSIEVAVFATGEAEGKPVLLYVTDGVRKLARGKSGCGNELTFQLPITRGNSDLGKLSIPAWPTRALTLGWLLVLSSRTRTLSAGVGFTADAPLIPNCDTDLSAVFTTTFNPLRTPQVDKEGEFSFVNILGITAAEATFAQRCGGSHLLHLLRHRALDQATKPTRSSVIGRSVVEPPKS